MKATLKKIIVLQLDYDEAKLLKELVQNALSDEESPDVAKLRKKLWYALNDQGVSRPYESYPT